MVGGDIVIFFVSMPPRGFGAAKFIMLAFFVVGAAMAARAFFVVGGGTVSVSVAVVAATGGVMVFVFRHGGVKDKDPKQILGNPVEWWMGDGWWWWWLVVGVGVGGTGLA